MPIDPEVHAPTRLQLMTMLSAVNEAEFATLRDHLDVSDSVLSKHLSALSAIGYVRTRKATHRGKRTTWIKITGTGRNALQSHVSALRALIDGVA